MVIKRFAASLSASILLAVGALLLPAAAPLAVDEPPKPPLGLPSVDWPEDNPYTHAKASLGKLLYFDNRLSSDQSVSCASCHAPEKAFTDSSEFSLGISKQKGGRSSPTVINRAYSTYQFWTVARRRSKNRPKDRSPTRSK